MENSINSKKRIGVLTSGGDAQGMNAAVRSVVRMATYLDSEVYAIMNGYQGLFEGQMKKIGWMDVSGIIQEGGTFIGTARCAAFMTREGRREAARNLLLRGIDRLIIIGGDGSLTGAGIFHKEWPELVKEVIEQEKKRTDISSHQNDSEDKRIPLDNNNQDELIPIDASSLSRHPELFIVGLVGSIDNDMCGTDQTIGADTALNHIVRAVDAIMNTAASHQREFVVEVMGRNCGWLALFGAIATAADWVFIPEKPPVDSWKEDLVSCFKKGKKLGKKSNIAILSEGAKDSHGKPITSEEVKNVLVSGGFETRITILGHVQRGGSPTAWDRNMTTIQGVKAAELALGGNGTSEPVLVGVVHNQITVTPLNTCLKLIKEITESVSRLDSARAMALRGNLFKEAYEIASVLTNVDAALPPAGAHGLRIGILHVGACCPGLNTAVRVAVRLGLYRGHTLLGINNGLDGLLNDEVYELQWLSVNGWAKEGGSRLGIRRVPSQGLDWKAINAAIERHRLAALMMIGGWDGYEAMLSLQRERRQSHLPPLPIALVPASISNNLPFSDYSIGSDTALNNIIDAVDKIRQSAVSSNRVFIVEVMGSNGYLALMSALATGADKVYIPEERMTLMQLQADIDDFASTFRRQNQSCLVINNESASKVFTTATLATLFEDNSKGCYIVRTAILGHLQQGGSPSGRLS